MNIQETELGVLISYETWDELQEKLEQSTHSEEINSLREENKNLKNALKQVEQRILNKGGSYV